MPQLNTLLLDFFIADVFSDCNQTLFNDALGWVLESVATNQFQLEVAAFIFCKQDFANIEKINAVGQIQESKSAEMRHTGLYVENVMIVRQKKASQIGIVNENTIEPIVKMLR